MTKFDKLAVTKTKSTQNPENLKIISFGRIAANTKYESLRKGLEDPRIKDGLRLIMGEVCDFVKEKEYERNEEKEKKLKEEQSAYFKVHKKKYKKDPEKDKRRVPRFPFIDRYHQEGHWIPRNVL